MKQIPFAAFPATEQQAVLQALRQAGITAAEVCVSRVELLEGEPCAFTSVSTRAWQRTYASDAAGDWIVALQRELATLAPGGGGGPRPALAETLTAGAVAP